MEHGSQSQFSDRLVEMKARCAAYVFFPHFGSNHVAENAGRRAPLAYGHRATADECTDGAAERRRLKGLRASARRLRLACETWAKSWGEGDDGKIEM